MKRFFVPFIFFLLSSSLYPQNPELNNYIPSDSGLPDNNVPSITIDTLENKWIGTCEGGLAVYKEAGVVLDKGR